jgi:hypothetical protein
MYGTILILLDRYLNLVFLTNLLRDTTVAHILCKYGETCATEINDDTP